MPFSATADGNVSGGTCSLTDDCHAGPNKAMPLPTMKHSDSRVSGVRWPSQATTDRAVAAASEIDSEISATTRRSYISAMAPAGMAISITGSIRAVWTRATLSADEVIWVIAQAAPTAWIKSPRLESRLANQIRRNTEWRNGAITPSEANNGRFATSTISHSAGAAAYLAPASSVQVMPPKMPSCPAFMTHGRFFGTIATSGLRRAAINDPGSWIQNVFGDSLGASGRLQSFPPTLKPAISGGQELHRAEEMGESTTCGYHDGRF